MIMQILFTIRSSSVLCYVSLVNICSEHNIQELLVAYISSTSAHFFSNICWKYFIFPNASIALSVLQILSLIYQKQLPFPCQITNENITLLCESVPFPLLNLFFMEHFYSNLNSILSPNCQLRNTHQHFHDFSIYFLCS